MPELRSKHAGKQRRPAGAGRTRGGPSGSPSRARPGSPRCWVVGAPLTSAGWQASAMRTVIVNGDALSVQDVIDVAGGEARAELGPGVPERMAASRQVVADAIAGDAAVYGVNTGFGALADTRVGEQDLRRLQGAIVLSHAAGVGEPLDDATVRAVLLLRARTLAAGYSGVRHDLPHRLLRFPELDLLPA